MVYVVGNRDPNNQGGVGRSRGHSWVHEAALKEPRQEPHQTRGDGELPWGAVAQESRVSQGH